MNNATQQRFDQLTLEIDADLARRGVPALVRQIPACLRSVGAQVLHWRMRPEVRI